MPKYEVNQQAVDHARELIEAPALRDSQQMAGRAAQCTRTKTPSSSPITWDEYGAWHLGLKIGAPEETKSRYAFVFGDLRRLHRAGLIACHYRAAEWDHKQIELAAHELLQLLDDKRR